MKYELYDLDETSRQAIEATAAGSSRQEALPHVDKGYRVEAVFEPIRQRTRDSERSNAEVEQLLDELTWEKKP